MASNTGGRDFENTNALFRRLIEMYVSSNILNNDITNYLLEAGIKKPQALLQKELSGSKDIASKNMKGFKAMSAITLLRYVKATQNIVRQKTQKSSSYSLDAILEKYSLFLSFYENPPDIYAIENHDKDASLEKYEEEVIIKLALYFKNQDKFLKPEQIKFITFLTSLPFVKQAEQALVIEKIKYMKRGTK